MQLGSTLDSFIRCNPTVLVEAKPSIQLHSQLLDAAAPRDFVFTEYNLWVPEGSLVRDQQSSGLFRIRFEASAVQPLPG